MQRPLRIRLDVPPPLVARAQWALAALSARWGVPVLARPGLARPDVVYGLASGAPPVPRVLRWDFDPPAWSPDARYGRRRIGERSCWVRAEADPGAPDLVAGAARLLAQVDEAAVPEARRDALGTFPAAALEEVDAALLAMPLVEEHAAALLAPLRRAVPALVADPEPRWPDGRSFAVALTHDVDTLRLGAPLELLSNLAKAVIRRDPVSARLVLAGLRHAGAPAADPFFAFPAWRRYEGQRGLRSAFYLFLRDPQAPAALHDSRSHVANTALPWEVLRDAVDAGWEFGLHPSLHARRAAGAFARSRAWLSERLGREVVGLRHHYYAFDWRAPHRTFRAHAAAGFRYDASLAWRDRAGFRAGTCLPFAPFDGDRDRPIDLVLLPTVLMDSHVATSVRRGTRAYLDNPAEVARADRLVADARAAGGLVVLNWHQEAICDDWHLAGVLARLEHFLLPLLADSDAWVATPAAIAAHWHERAARLQRRAVG